uniref:DUF4291 domain-containing protein n=1 Tax=Chromera velia CCMP2878 TaxID=1169474 RepID=A0A0G4G8W5_9ALVE|eukprot:Cvel_20785.t1-p1 / transcript=Cvel_20785.t1 / gene=Cvel_20785 / organism=Chromera_velia_CCMP2878 / gene_product=hypothetical protein / transcript_product=hypothetical protein / location=Cvel_scaffold1897:25750-28528(+) / protein_length=354 / sequence_SO=supercontig / SO=protein_coding / is_pseudo=false
MSKLALEPFSVATKKWPAGNRSEPLKCILAQTSEDSVIVYQAYKPAIAECAVKEQKFAGCPHFSETRMTWIKTKFLWMNFRSGWNTKRDQERTLALWVKKEAFDSYLAKSVSSKDNDQSLKKRPGLIRLQWDPDHTHDGSAVGGRRAIQLGLRSVVSFVDGSDLTRIEDVTWLIEREREKLQKMQKEGADTEAQRHSDLDLVVPIERPYFPPDPSVCEHIGLSPEESCVSPQPGPGPSAEKKLEEMLEKGAPKEPLQSEEKKADEAPKEDSHPTPQEEQKKTPGPSPPPPSNPIPPQPPASKESPQGSDLQSDHSHASLPSGSVSIGSRPDDEEDVPPRVSDDEGNCDTVWVAD